MENILYAIAILGGLGLLFGAVLAIASPTAAAAAMRAVAATPRRS